MGKGEKRGERGKGMKKRGNARVGNNFREKKKGKRKRGEERSVRDK